METPARPVVVFHGRNEFEAQMARDVLTGSMIPVLHLPSLSTGLFGVPQTTRVAVPPDFVEAAMEALTEAGFEPRLEETPHGVAAFQDTVHEGFPVGRHRSSPVREDSVLRRVLIGLAVVILSLAVYAALRHR